METQAEDGATDNFYHRWHFLKHRLGLQSNIVIAARYTRTGEESYRLSKPAVYAALKSVITKRPELANVGVIRPSKKKGRHRMHVAILHEIDLDFCVEFVDGIAPDASFLERCHNEEWGWSAVEAGRPWWKVFILNGREVVFVVHHSVCDGAFGLIFHRDMVIALNSASPADLHNAGGSDTASVVKINPFAVLIAPDVLDLIDEPPSILSALVMFVFWNLLRLFISNKRLFFSDAAPPHPTTLGATDVAAPEQRTTTRVSTTRIPAADVAAILAACRAHNTTFTPFIVVLLAAVLATEHYPSAWLGFTRYAIDMRPLLGPPPAGTTIMDTAGGMDRVQRLGHIRRAAANPDREALWTLVREYGAWMLSNMTGIIPPTLRDWKKAHLMGSDLEDMISTTLPALGLVARNSFSVSNIGAFAGDGDREGKLRIDDVQFSAAASDGTYFYNGIVFNVAGVKGGDTIINATYEDRPDGLKKEMVDDVLGGLMRMANTMLPEGSLSVQKQ